MKNQNNYTMMEKKLHDKLLQSKQTYESAYKVLESYLAEWKSFNKEYMEASSANFYQKNSEGLLVKIIENLFN